MSTRQSVSVSVERGNPCKPVIHGKPIRRSVFYLSKVRSYLLVQVREGRLR